MNKAAGDHNFPTFGMAYYGHEAGREAGQPALSRQDFYLRCDDDDDFKAAWAPLSFLDLEYIEVTLSKQLYPLLLVALARVPVSFG